MHNKIASSYLAWALLFSTIAGTYFYISWALSPLKFEQADIEEELAFQFRNKKKYKEATNHFLKAAELDDNDLRRSRRYKMAANTSESEKDKIKYSNMALKYKAASTHGYELLESQIVYVNRYSDGWSMGKHAKAVITVLEDISRYRINYYTNNPEIEKPIISIYIDGKEFKKQNIINKIKKSLDIELNKGNHQVDLVIDHSFIPKSLGDSADQRELGFKFNITKTIIK